MQCCGVVFAQVADWAVRQTDDKGKQLVFTAKDSSALAGGTLTGAILLDAASKKEGDDNKTGKQQLVAIGFTMMGAAKLLTAAYKADWGETVVQQPAPVPLTAYQLCESVLHHGTTHKHVRV